jgi:choline dehydrogenase-like flavoprotein
MGQGELSRTARRTLLSLARVAMPPGRQIPAPDAATIARLSAYLDGKRSLQLGLEGLVRTFRLLTRARSGRDFEALEPERQLSLLQALFGGSYPERQLLRALLTPLKAAHYDDPRIFERLGQCYRREPVNEAPPRYLQQTSDAAALEHDETIEAEVVVVGSGAGGAALAAALAEAGVATVVLEEGGYYRRKDFTGRPLEMMKLLYRDTGLTATVGNCVIPVPMGRCVGGTTTVNSGTCFRTPERVLRKWREEHGLDELSAASLRPHFERVEAVLQVTPAERRVLGGIAEVIGRGCTALGIRHHGPLPRNAPDCDGSALCCFGCPTDAKRSTNISFLPLALRAGANLHYNARVERVLVERGRACGVVARNGAGRRLTVRARAVALACGTLMTPALLLRQGLCNASGQLGRNLSLHPALAPFAYFPRDRIDGARSIPQGYGIEDLHDEGILFENVFVPADFGAGSVTFFGPRFTELMEDYDRIAAMGFMIEDTSRGRVRLAPGGRPVMTYVMNDHDVARLKRGLDLVIRLYLAAGAEAVFPMVPGFVEIRDAREVARFQSARFRARDFELTAHHPLGTAKMGRDPKRSVVGPSHEAHDLPGLFICDGSALPSSLGVNPQVTIMALADRAARHVARAVERT